MIKLTQGKIKEAQAVIEVNGVNSEKTAWHHIRHLSVTSPIIHHALTLGKVHGWSDELTLLNMALEMNKIITAQDKEISRIHETSVIRVINLGELWEDD